MYDELSGKSLVMIEHKRKHLIIFTFFFSTTQDEINSVTQNENNDHNEEDEGNFNLLNILSNEK